MYCDVGNYKFNLSWLGNFLIWMFKLCNDDFILIVGKIKKNFFIKKKLVWLLYLIYVINKYMRRYRFLIYNIINRYLNRNYVEFKRN